MSASNPFSVDAQKLLLFLAGPKYVSGAHAYIKGDYLTGYFVQLVTDTSLVEISISLHVDEAGYDKFLEENKHLDSRALEFLDTNRGFFLYRENDADYPDRLAAELPGIRNMVKHPEEQSEQSLFDVIMSLNDKYKWSRDAIADWIESLDEVPVFDPKESERKKLEKEGPMVLSDEYKRKPTLLFETKRILSGEAFGLVG